MRSIQETQVRNKKGAAMGKGIVLTMVGLIIAIVIITALAPEAFSNLADFNATGSPNAPAWLFTVLPIVVAAGILFLVLRSALR